MLLPDRHWRRPCGRGEPGGAADPVTWQMSCRLLRIESGREFTFTCSGDVGAGLAALAPPSVGKSEMASGAPFLSLDKASSFEKSA
jgi:hypothetical protein